MAASHGSSSLHSPSVRRFPLFPLLLCFSFTVCLPPRRDADDSVLERHRRSGDGIDVAILVTQKCVGASRTRAVTSESKLCRRTRQLFSVLQGHKEEEETEERDFYPNVLIVGRRRSLEMTNEPNISFPHCCSCKVLSCGTDQQRCIILSKLHD